MNRKMKYILAYLLTIVLTVYFAGCSELNTEIPQAPDISTHGEGSLSASHPNFHGNYLSKENWDFKNCQQCHASDFQGGITGISCTNCHNSIAVHKDSLNNVASPNFHGKSMAANNWDLNQCQQCHSTNFEGSPISPSCLTCHPSINVHREGINDPASENFHGKFIASNSWDLMQCRQCHAADYSGGFVSSSCLTCHTQKDGPEACNTCHGDFSDPSKIAPPTDISGNTSTTIKSVGAHSKHLLDNTLGNKVSCGSCHQTPQSVYDAGHMDSQLPAEVLLKETATLFGASDASYNDNSATCSNTYCHGNFVFYKDSAVTTNQFAYASDRMIGISNAVDWTKIDGTQIQCGTCHGLPPEGHIQVPLNACYQCHRDVIDKQGNIIDKNKHINGVKDARN